jgi:hypothetical protein
VAPSNCLITYNTNHFPLPTVFFMIRKQILHLTSFVTLGLSACEKKDVVPPISTSAKTALSQEASSEDRH